MYIPPEVHNSIRFHARRYYVMFTPALRCRYTLADLEQEGYVVYQKCIRDFGGYELVNLTNKKPLNFYRSWFLGYLNSALKTNFNRIVRDHLRMRRDARIRIIPLETLNSDRFVANDFERIRAELRTDLEHAKKRVSPKCVELIDLILTIADKRRLCDTTVLTISQKLQLSRYKTLQIIEELRNALER